MSNTAILPDVIAALACDGFEPTLTVRGVTFHGRVVVRGIEVRLRVEFRNLEFCEPPYVFVENPSDLPRPVLPHLDEKNELCVVDRRAFVADRYAAPAQARGIILRAREVIECGLTRHATTDISNEFPQHWGGKGVGVQFGAYVGPTQQSNDPGQFVRIRPSDGKTTPTGFAVVTQTQLSFADKQRRPDTLDEFLSWAGYWDNALPDRVIAALGDLSATDPHILISAPNGMVGFRLMVSSRGRQQVDALKRPDGWRRALHTPVIRGLPIERDHGYRADVDYALERSGDGVAVLSGKQVVLVGCGAIGGFLARSLAQLGAGRGEGSLLMIDDDTLAVANVGRHALGMGDIDRPKAEACRDRIVEDLPGGHLVWRSAKIEYQRQLVESADVVIEATGEQGVGEMLNAWMLGARASARPFPSLFHVWIEGAGAAVQSFMSSDAEFACLRCLKPDLNGASRFSALRDEAKTRLVGGCGEALFTPYGPAAPMMAAALAAQHVYDWAKGHPRPLLRTSRLDWANTKEIKPTNPTAARCPACGRG